MLLVVPVGMWAKASISLLSELAREAGEAQPEPQQPHQALRPLAAPEHKQAGGRAQDLPVSPHRAAIRRDP